MARTYSTGKHHKRDPKTGRIKAIVWTPALKKLAHDLYVKQGLSVDKVSKEVGVAPMTLYNHLKSLGLNRRVRIEHQSAYAWLESNKKKVLKMYETQSAQQIAVKTGLEIRVVVKWLKHVGVFRTLQSERVSVARASGRHVTTARRDRSIRDILAVDIDRAHYLEYKIAVAKLTDYMFQDWGHCIDPDGTRSYEVHLDHIFGVNHAFKDGRGNLRKRRCPLTMIAHPANLRMLSRAQNSNRHNIKDPLACDIEALKKRIISFEKKHGNPFAVYQAQA